VKSYVFLFWAYNVIWFGIAGFILFVHLRVRGAEGKLERLENEIQRRTSPEHPSA